MAEEDIMVTAVAQDIAFAEYDPKEGSLTFWYTIEDYWGSQSDHQYYKLNTSAGENPEWSERASIIQKVIIDSSFARYKPTCCWAWFRNFYIAIFEGLKNLDTSEVTTMGYMFCNIFRVGKELDLSSFDTSKVTDMSNMFNNDNTLQHIYVSSKWNTDNVTQSDNMFNGCFNLPNYDQYKVDKTKAIAVKDGGYLTFKEDLKIIKDGKEIIRMYKDGKPIDEIRKNGVLVWCPKIEAYAEYTNGVLTFRYDYRRGHYSTTYSMPKNNGKPAWLTNASSITTVMFNKSFRYYKPTSCYGWFYGCTVLTSVDNIEYLDTSECTTIAGLFGNCSSLTNLDLSSLDTSKVTAMNNVFYGCKKLSNINVANWNTSKVLTLTRAFSGCSALTTLDVSKWDVGNVQNMSYTFYRCSALKNIDVSSWNTYNVTNMGYMFYECSKLSSLDVSNWDVSSVLDMVAIFFNCSSLTELNVNKWDVSRVRNMSFLFYGCSGLTELNVSNWNTCAATSMKALFYNCSGLTTLDLINWKTSNVTDMSYMLEYMSKVTKIDISSLNTSNVTTMNFMFYGGSLIEHIYVGDSWNVDNATSSIRMFEKCSKLPNFDSTKLDKTMAKLDTEGGYLTYKFNRNFRIGNRVYQLDEDNNWVSPEDVTITNNEAFASDFDVKIPLLSGNTITYKRDVKTNVYQSLCLPFYVDLMSIKTVTFYEITSITPNSDGTASYTVQEVIGGIPAGTPVIFKSSKDTISLSTLFGDSEASLLHTPIDSTYMKGSFNSMEVPKATNTYIINNNKLIQTSSVSGTPQLDAYRAYFVVPSTSTTSETE